MTLVEKFEEFLEKVDLRGYREKYSGIKIVEMDLSKDIQAIELLYKVYWDEKNFLSFDDFYNRYLKEKRKQLEKFRVKSTMCKDCFYRGLKARIYRTWAGLITQIHAGYVAESVFGKGAVSMSAELDSQGADIRVNYKNHLLNYQVKKTSHSGVMSRRPLPRKNKLEGEGVDIKYEVPSSDYFENPKKRNGEYKLPYKRFTENKALKRFSNGFVVFTPHLFKIKKSEIDHLLK